MVRPSAPAKEFSRKVPGQLLVLGQYHYVLQI